MTIRRSSRIALSLAACGVPVLLSGCFMLWGRAPEPAPPAPPFALRGQPVRALAVVPLEAEPGLEAGAERFRAALETGLKARIGSERLRSADGWSGLRGYLGVSQAAQAGAISGADALLTGRVIAWNRQTQAARVWVSAGFRLLEAGRGSIMYAHDATAEAPCAPGSDVNAAFDLALHLATQEFIDGLLGTSRS